MGRILDKTRCYLSGHMQYKNGAAWRENTQNVLEDMGVKVFNPYKSIYIEPILEGPEQFATLKQLMNEEKLEEVRTKFSKVRNYDLGLVDKSDFIVCHIYPEIASWGTGEELAMAALQRKPTFISVEGGRTKCPLWIAAQFPSRYIYNSQEELLETLRKINSGEIIADSDRWRLLKPDFR
jgi:nucleoside 2-deoxyribosyltransferase